MNTQTSRDVYTIVTNRIIELLEKGVIPWRQPWTDAGLPKNMVSGKHYRGINVWLLNSLNYPQNNFLSFRQIKELGGSVKKGERSQEVVFWKWIEKENPETGEIDKKPFLRYHRVFNISQCEGIPKEKIPQEPERNISPLESCEKIIAQMPKCPEIRNYEQKAYYNRFQDLINMPRMETFSKTEEYYGTLFHELIHSSGHADRLNRKELLESKGFGTRDYAIEELTAEMGASYLKSHAGIPIEELNNNAAYISGWLERLKDDKKFIIHASAQAQKATDYILNNLEIEKDPAHLEAHDKEQQTLIDKEEEVKKIRDKNMETATEIEV
jgi:antirestriction protein ArdC